MIVYSVAAGAVSIAAMFMAGILPGVFTATEAAAIAVAYAFLLCG